MKALYWKVAEQHDSCSADPVSCYIYFSRKGTATSQVKTGFSSNSGQIIIRKNEEGNFVTGLMHTQYS